MELSERSRMIYIRRLMTARMRILAHNGFYGLILMHMGFTLDEEVKTAATDGMKIYFAPSFLDKISDSELIFVLQHEVLHVVLRHVTRRGIRNNFLYNIACDIVVNSNILYSENMNQSRITLEGKPVIHLAPDGKEGYLYTTEEVFEMLCRNMAQGDGGDLTAGLTDDLTDEHDRWGSAAVGKADVMMDTWIRTAYETSRARGAILSPALERSIGTLFSASVDWRQILNEFVQEEITDYSFSPPDRRYSDSEFFLPDYNDTEAVIRKMLFWIDTSASISDEQITLAYSEIKGAIDQFNGKLEGWLGFFDTQIYDPVPFGEERDLLNIRPKGGGGTDFGIVFSYIADQMQNEEISGIIILTDGLCSFPEEPAAGGKPVLWAITGDKVIPPWGKFVKIG